MFSEMNDTFDQVLISKYFWKYLKNKKHLQPLFVWKKKSKAFCHYFQSKVGGVDDLGEGTVSF